MGPRREVADAGEPHSLILRKYLADCGRHGVDRAFCDGLAQPHPTAHTADNSRFVGHLAPCIAQSSYHRLFRRPLIGSSLRAGREAQLSTRDHSGHREIPGL